MNKVAVIGIGRLGLCFALNLEKAGFLVWGIDKNDAYIESIRSKKLKSNEPQLEKYLVEANSFFPSNSYESVVSEGIAYIFILVPTPSLPDGSYSHDYINAVVDELLQQALPKGKSRHLIIGSTVMPGYCDDLAKRISKYGYTVTYNPEFIAQGSIIQDQQHPDQLLIGEGDEQATKMLKAIYAKMCLSNPAIHIMDRKSAEITKLATNCFLTMKISFANSIGDLATESGADPDKILAAIGSDSRIGNKYLKYGFGFGGPCFPRDNQALIRFSENSGQPFRLSKTTIIVNTEHLLFKLKKLLIENKDEYEFDHITYKKDTDIIEESQQLLLALELVRAGKKVILKNSWHVKDKLEKEYPSFFSFM